jgi:hypothetical protein
MECGKNNLAAKKKTSGLWVRFLELKLATLEVPEYAWRHECAPRTHATLQATKEHASAGTTRVEAFSVEIPQMVVFQKGSGTGNLQSHVVSKHRSAALTA